MPPRRRQQYRRPSHRRRAGPQREDRVSDQALDAAARGLAASYSVAELRSLVQRSREAYQLADQQAQQEPSPEALLRYRAAKRALAEAERALALAEGESDSSA